MNFTTVFRFPIELLLRLCFVSVSSFCFDCGSCTTVLRFTVDLLLQLSFVSLDVSGFRFLEVVVRIIYYKLYFIESDEFWKMAIALTVR